MLFASSSMHSKRPYLCIEIVFICDTWSLEVTSYNTCKLSPSPSPFPAFWGTEVTGVVFLDLASATESHCLPHWEKQVDGKISGALENLGIWLFATSCRAGYKTYTNFAPGIVPCCTMMLRRAWWPMCNAISDLKHWSFQRPWVLCRSTQAILR